ncbi:heterokaryon incompatibility protein-domain-containing protein [Lenzites betulinus]|nr:heterokaryon incompatibility protein-domain-containing protein [Lenzites betulinus]
MLEDQTLLQLPFFPYGDCRLAGYTLPPKPDSLCASCWEGPLGAHATWLFDVADDSQPSWLPSPSKSYSYCVSKADLMSSIDMGCAWCILVYSEVLSIAGYRGYWEPGPVNIDIEVGLSFDDELIGCDELTDHPAAKETRTHAPILDVGSARAFGLARELMQKCEREHERCRTISNPAEATTLPKRLINCVDPERPHLVETSEGERGRYVALSYVWGKNQPHKTTLSTLFKYEAGLDLALLPQTIRDAIRVTRELGFELLWVDSLCIVQDLASERLHEIGRMHHIFRYAAFTIVAASARDVGEGFLHDRQPVQPFEWKTFSLPILSRPASATAAPQVGTLTLYSDSELPGMSSGPNYKDQPTSQRAWCLEEQLMSPRSLLFFSHTLLFRCQMATHSIGTSFYNWATEVRLPDALLLQTPSPSEHDTSDWHGIHDTWKRVVREYTRRSMTKPADKLVACGAVAKIFHCALNTDYLAGLWRHSLLGDLLWHVVKPQRRPEVSRAPSWSWAAVDSEVRMYQSFSAYDINVAEIIRCDVRLKEDSLPFGEVSSGSLVMRAQLLRLQRMEKYVWQLQYNPTERLLRYHHRSVAHEEDAAADSVLWHDMRWRPSYDFQKAPDPDSTLWAIPFMHTDKHSMHGLILARAEPASSDPTSASSKTLYRRIGSFVYLQCQDFIENERVLARPLKNKEVPLQEIEII